MPQKFKKKVNSLSRQQQQFYSLYTQEVVHKCKVYAIINKIKFSLKYVA